MDRRSFLLGSLATAVVSGSLGAAPKKKHRVAIIGCGRMGQYYAEVYRSLPDTELVAIAEWNDERRPIVGRHFGIKALFKDVHKMLAKIVPDVAAVITPTKFVKEAVIACAEAGVKGVSTDKPIAARLSDADEMVQACARRGVVFAGGNLQRAKWEVQQAAGRLGAGELGNIRGAAVHGFWGEISGGGCQHLSVLRLFTHSEVEEVIAWANPPEALDRKDDHGLNINERFHLTSGIDCQVFGRINPDNTSGQKTRVPSGVDLWTDDALVRWEWRAPKIFRGTDDQGARREIDPDYPPFPWKDVLEKTPGLREGDDYLVSSIRSFLRVVETGCGELWISGHDLKQALEIAIACKLSAQLGNLPVRLPLKDRSLALYPRPYRWLGGDVTGRPQSTDSAAGREES